MAVAKALIRAGMLATAFVLGTGRDAVGLLGRLAEAGYELAIELLGSHDRDPRGLAWMGRTRALGGFDPHEGHDRVREAITAAVTQPFTVDGRRVEVGLSIGVALSTDGSADPDHLLREADAAMYREKAAARRR
ncbi:hypothetical protein Ani05nite_27910 [Amorphoplanes nipponensis]|uniref:GGDEF domain-containing protein n=1 Tax=Actinoplanes nipponensis TaxID=135950 RepID=A0A919JHM6_9ACTN|nr:diguanylate cyclase [Actinoplanes nipponensis]GIE49257.1 hypothetical protein Ani05nite_27910 [Actinoplanes nipponensis]